jgi:hypothetical protein
MSQMKNDGRLDGIVQRQVSDELRRRWTRAPIPVTQLTRPDRQRSNDDLDRRRGSEAAEHGAEYA